MLVISAGGCSSDEKEPDASGQMRDITSVELVKYMKLGWNLGNTLEACGAVKNTVTDYETLWGNPVTTPEMIKGIHDAGFSTIRIPVAWSNLMKDDYTIDSALFSRVKEVIGYAVECDMYAILNIHWDGGWFKDFPTKYDECMKKYTRIWEQISAEFKDYSDKLVFESLNEEGCWDSVWNRYSGGDKEGAYGILNDMNQNFVNIVRASGGNNQKRHLLIAGYCTDIALTCDPCFKMPEDPENRCIVSVHYYTPSTFTILEEDADWGKCAEKWGSDAEIAELNRNMAMLKETFVDKGIPVIVGEYGSTTKNKDADSVRLYIKSVCKAAYDLDMCPVFWDNGAFYDRSALKFRDNELAAIFKEISDSGRKS